MIHFNKLSDKGIDTVIIQNIAKFNNGEPVVCYYASEIYDFPKVYNDFLNNVLHIANEIGIKIIVGICTDSYWWKYSEHNYNDETMKKFYCEEINTISEIISNYAVRGIYYSNELYSNPKGFEKIWSGHLNKILSFLNKNGELPLYISPFTSSVFTQTKNSIVKMWERFFKITEFRYGDKFLLQDGFGNLSADPKKKECEKIYNLDKKIRDACIEYSRADFVLNIELFAKDGYASLDRISEQILYANKLGNEISCFSVSHYFIDDQIWL